MSKKKDKIKFIAEIDDESGDKKELMKQFIAKSKDGLIVGNSKDEGNHFTILPEKDDISIHKTEIEPDGNKKYPYRGSLLNFINGFENLIITCKTTSDILEKLSPNSFILIIPYEDFENEDIVKKENNTARFNIINFLMTMFERLEELELLNIENLETIIEKYTKGFIIVDMDKKKFYMITPKDDNYILFDMSEMFGFINDFFGFDTNIDDNKQSDISDMIIKLVQRKMEKKGKKVKIPESYMNPKKNS